MFNILNTKHFLRTLKIGSLAACTAVAFSLSPVNVEKAEATSIVGYPTHMHGTHFKHHRFHNRRHFKRRFHHRRHFRRHHRGIHIGIGGPRYFGPGYHGGGYYGGGYPVPVAQPVPVPVYCPIPVQPPVALPAYGGGYYGGGAAVGPLYNVFQTGGC